MIKKETNLKGKKILITGGSGSIGIELIKQILKEKPSNIRILSNNENSIFELKKIFGSNQYITYLLGDIRDKDRLKLAIRDIDIVFHGAAMKRVDVCEENPFDAVKVNVMGTSNILEVSLLENVSKFVYISTEKAVNASTTMGASKFLAERLAINAGSYRGKGKTSFSIVRLGNVFGSKGSVSQIFLERIRKGLPIEITDKTTSRFFISIPEAASFVLKIAKIGKDGEIYIPKMTMMKIYDLGANMIKFLQKNSKIKKSKIQIKQNFVENSIEYLISKEELPFCYETKEMFSITKIKNKKNYSLEHFSSDKSKKMENKKFEKILKDLINQEN